MFKIYNKMFIRAFFIQSLWNFERLQNIGFLFVLKPYIDELYADKEKRKEAFLRHLGFFNTHPYMANIIAAIAANIEKKKSLGENAGDVNMLKSSLAGPLAALGDSFFWGTVRPVVSFVCVFLIILFTQVWHSHSSDYAVIIPAIFLFCYNLFHIPLRYWFILMGFKLDKESFKIIAKFEVKFIWEAMRYFGLFAVGASIVFYIIAFGFLSPERVIPEAVVYAAAFGLAVLLGKISPTVMFYAAVLFCITMSYLRI